MFEMFNGIVRGALLYRKVNRFSFAVHNASVDIEPRTRANSTTRRKNVRDDGRANRIT